jgi:hypothetical protein
MLKKGEAAARAKAQEEADEMAGFQAFPSTQFSDHLRGLNSFIPEVRCPFKRPGRRAAWQRGYQRVYDALVEAFGD